MHLLICRLIAISLVFALSPSSIAQAAEHSLNIAVASNFARPMTALVSVYQEQTHSNIQISTASSGKLYAQIRQGAPFDVFFSADQDKVAKLIDEKLGFSDSRFTYAIGKIALWSAMQLDSHDLKARLSSGQYNKLAMANPRHAPYGIAAQQVLKRLQIHIPSSKNVMAENVNQCFQYTKTGNTDLGFVALSQLIHGQNAKHYWLVPQDLYTPIKQDAIVLNSSKNKTEASRFIEFLRSPAAINVISQFGYSQSKS